MPANEVLVVRDRESLRYLADTLPDGPTTVISRHLLQRGLCTAYVTGRLEQVDALIVDGGPAGEPSCHGTDVDATWAGLRDVPGWFAANVDEAFAADLQRRVQDDERVVTRTLGDLHFVLRTPVVVRGDPRVWLLTPDDVGLLDCAPTELRGAGFESSQAMLREGVVAAAIVDDRIVSIAHVGAVTDGFADIGVATADAWRNQGLSTACASLVAREIQAWGRVPVWSCGETNAASLSVATKLGFELVDRRVYVIRDDRRPWTNAADSDELSTPSQKHAARRVDQGDVSARTCVSAFDA